MSLPALVDTSETTVNPPQFSESNNPIHDQAAQNSKHDPALIATAAVLTTIVALVCLLCVRRVCRKRWTRHKQQTELPVAATASHSSADSSMPAPHAHPHSPALSPPYSRYDDHHLAYQSPSPLPPPTTTTPSSSPTSSLKSPSYARYWARLFGSNKGKRPMAHADPEKSRQLPLSRRASTLLSRSSSLSSGYPSNKLQSDFYLGAGKDAMCYGDLKLTCPIITLTSPTNSDTSIPLQEHFMSSSSSAVGGTSAEILEQSLLHDPPATLLAIPASTSSSSSASSSSSSSSTSPSTSALAGTSSSLPSSSSDGAAPRTSLSAYEKRIAATRQHLEDQHQDHVLTDFPPSYEEAIDAGAGVGPSPGGSPSAEVPGGTRPVAESNTASPAVRPTPTHVRSVSPTNTRPRAEAQETTMATTSALAIPSITISLQDREPTFITNASAPCSATISTSSSHATQSSCSLPSSSPQPKDSLNSIVECSSSYG